MTDRSSSDTAIVWGDASAALRHIARRLREKTILPYDIESLERIAAIPSVAQTQPACDNTEHVDWDAMAEKRLGWKRGLPPGQYYEGMVDDYEVSFAIAGGKWHRRRTEEEKQAYIAMKAELERRKAAFTSASPLSSTD